MIGETLGIEEEYHLVEAETLQLLNRPALADRTAAGGTADGTHTSLHAEMLASQLEAVTGICRDLGEARAAIIDARRTASRAAADEGAVLLATSTHPTSGLDEIEVLERARYTRLIDRFGAIVRKFNLCGLHVHVGVPDLDTALAVMAHARPYLPVLLALTASSPFHEGADTGYASFRTAWLALWPQGGLPPRFDTAADYTTTVAALAASGLVDDGTALLWDLRPSSRYPTLEFRIADMCPDLDDVVLYAALVRSLVRTLGERVQGGAPPHDVPDAVLRAARWRAARYGLTDTLWSPGQSALVPAGIAVDELLAELRDDLEARGEYDTVADLLARLRSRGSSAERQRATLTSTGQLDAVVRELVELTSRGL